MPMLSTADLLELGNLRRQRLDEGRRHLADMFGIAEAEPGTVGRVARMQVPGLQDTVDTLESDIAQDPDTGLGAQRRFHDIQTQIDTQNMFNRPESIDTRARQRSEAADLEQQTARAKAYGTGVGTAQAGMTPEAQTLHKQGFEEKMRLEHPYMDATGNPSNEVGYWADQVTREPNSVGRLGKDLKDAVQAELANRGTDLEDLTNQAKSRAEAATNFLPKIQELGDMAAKLNDAGWFAPGVGTVRRFLAEHGLGMVTGDSELAHLMSQFNSTLGFTLSGLQNAHAGVKGAASRDLKAAFEKLLNASGDLPTFGGQLEAIKELLQGYAAPNAPVVNGQRVLPGAAPADPWGPPTPDEIARSRGGR